MGLVTARIWPWQSILPLAPSLSPACSPGGAEHGLPWVLLQLCPPLWGRSSPKHPSAPKPALGGYQQPPRAFCIQLCWGEIHIPMSHPYPSILLLMDLGTTFSFGYRKNGLNSSSSAQSLAVGKPQDRREQN